MTPRGVLLYIFFPLFLTICTNIAIIFLIMNDLMKNNPLIWEELGKRSLLNSSIQNNFSMTKFLYSGRYRRIDNRRVRLLGDIAIALTPIILILFVIFVLKTGGKGLHFRLP